MSEPHGKNRTFADFGMNEQPRAMAGKDMLYDGKSQARPFFERLASTLTR